MAGIPYDELGSTTLIKTQLSYLAELHRMELAARVHVDMKMAEYSGPAAAKLEREKAAKEGEEEDNPLDIRRGVELSAERRLSLEFKTWAPHRQAAYVRRHGWPWETHESTVQPYEGMTPELAREMLALMSSGKLDRFTDFWEVAGDGNVQDKLEETAKA